jgi:hypothetical protein
MKHIQRLAVLFSGFALGYAVALVGGIIEAQPIPRAYFDYFGRQHVGTALFLEEAVVFALPIFILSLAWCVATLWRFRARVGEAAAWSFAGLVLAWAVSFGPRRMLRAFIQPILPRGPLPMLRPGSA